MFPFPAALFPGFQRQDHLFRTMAACNGSHDARIRHLMRQSPTPNVCVARRLSGGYSSRDTSATHSRKLCCTLSGSRLASASVQPSRRVLDRSRVRRRTPAL